MRSEETLQLLETEGAKHLMRQLYGETAEENVNRYRHVVQKFHDTFGDQDMMRSALREEQRSVETTPTIITEKCLQEALIWIVWQSEQSTTPQK